MKHPRRSLLINDQAQTIAEYAMILAVVVLAVVGTLYVLYKTVNGLGN